jgi:hypothetical protein
VLLPAAFFAVINGVGWQALVFINTSHDLHQLLMIKQTLFISRINVYLHIYEIAVFEVHTLLLRKYKFLVTGSFVLREGPEMSPDATFGMPWVSFHKFADFA